MGLRKKLLEKVQKMGSKLSGEHSAAATDEIQNPEPFARNLDVDPDDVKVTRALLKRPRQERG